MAVTRFAKVRQTKFRDSAEAREFTDVYLVHLDDANDARQQILDFRPDFQIGSLNPEDPVVRVSGFSADQRKHSLIFDVTVDYSSQQQPLSDPLAEPAAVEVTTTDVTLPVTTDHQGQPLLYTNGRPILGVEETFSFLVFSVEKKISPSYPEWLLKYPQALNSDLVRFKNLPLEPRTLKIARIRIGRQEIQDRIPYVPLYLEIVHNPLTWDRFFLNRGLEEVIYKMEAVPNQSTGGNTSTERAVLFTERCTDQFGEFLTEPAFLDLDGRRPRVRTDEEHEGEPVTLEEDIRDGLTLAGKTRLKHPIEQSDIVVLRKTLRKPLPFNDLPLR